MEWADTHWRCCRGCRWTAEAVGEHRQRMQRQEVGRLGAIRAFGGGGDGRDNIWEVLAGAVGVGLGK